jgi:4-aminobutyrate aminotransferase-like enzyme/Ser/Thr protein kinase RdoA (MazF antagonist)
MDAPTTNDWLLARPEIDAEQVRDLAWAAFRVEGEVRELGSQQDRNFLFTPPTGRGALVKVNHPTVSEEAISLQVAISDRYREVGLSTPQVLSTVDGDRSVTVEVEGGATARVVAFAAVTGETLADVVQVDGALAEELGVLAARSVLALQNLDHPGADRKIQWELTHALEVVERLAADLPPDRRQSCRDAAAAAMSRIQELGDLPRQVVHGDLNCDNIMRDGQGTDWIVDLGDAARSWRVAEIAMVAADVLGRSGDLALVSRAVRGYAATAPLSDDEIDAVWPLVVLRGAVLAVSGWSQLRIDPDNAYARERIEHEWTVFERAASYDHREATAQLRLAAGRPHHRGGDYAPVLAGVGGAQIVDLGIRSRALDRGRWTSDSAELDLARAALEDSPVAVMRFGETRLSRTSSDTASPAATKSRVVDLWTRPGTAVHAPFSGAVTVGDGHVELSDAGVTLRLDGVAAQEDRDRDAVQGEVLGRVVPAGSGVGRVRVTRRMLGAQASPPFGAPGEEFETEGGADPSVIVGTASAPDPIVHLRRERKRRDRAMVGAAERYYRQPPQIERGWNTLLIDTEGRAYLDMVNNVTAIGHSHPRFADRVGRQLELLNTNSRFLYEAYADFVDSLLERSPDPSLDTVIPVNSGSEAVDLAIRLAQVATGRKDVIAVREGYHGWTMAADSVSTSAFDNPDALASRPDWVHLVDAPNPYRGTHRGHDSGPAYVQQVADLTAQLVQQGRTPAAFICEPVLGNAGGVVPPDGYLAGAYDALRAHGGLAIADEVQVGYGRLGRAFWGSAMQGAAPDIITVAKAAGNAYPIGAVITRREIVEALQKEGMFFSSAGGAPASAIAAATVLDVIRDEGLQENALRVGTHLITQVERLAKKHPIIGTVHGSGLYLGVELVRDRETLEPAAQETVWVCERLLELGIVMQATSERQNVLKVKPPLTLNVAEADAFVAALDTALTEVGNPAIIAR